MRIGIDFDNTIAGYDRVFPKAAAEMGLLAGPCGGGKTAIRDALRRRPGGEDDWQRLQGQVYGRFMAEADLIAGVAPFLATAKAAGAKVVIVSHKTQFGHADPARIDLRDAARAWMTARGFFDPVGFALSPGDVHFLPTRAEKIVRIAELALDVFIDDLAEVFAEPGFPITTRGLLFTNGEPAPKGPFESISDWDAIAHAVFPAHA